MHFYLTQFFPERHKQRQGEKIYLKRCRYRIDFFRVSSCGICYSCQRV